MIITIKFKENKVQMTWNESGCNYLSWQVVPIIDHPQPETKLNIHVRII